jgi:hypothetical protein
MVNMKQLIIIYGPPRSATSFLLDCLVEHPLIRGVNEPPGIDYLGDPDNVVTLDKLWEEKVVRAGGWMVPEEQFFLALKAPGYCFAYPYFNYLEKMGKYKVFYIHVSRDPFEVVDSMLKHEQSIGVLNMDIVSTDCPRDMLAKYGPLWKKAKTLGEEAMLVNRAMLRYEWHIGSIHMNMLEKSLVLAPYRKRGEAKRIADELVEHLGIVESEAMTEALGKFYHRKVSKKVAMMIEELLMPEMKVL